MNKQHSDKRNHLFSVDILIEDTTNGKALETLLHLLNSQSVKDYRIKSGITLGSAIAAAEQHSTEITPIAIQPKIQKVPKRTEKAESLAPQDKGIPKQVIEQLDKYKNNNTLVRLSIVKAKGIRLSLPCRILNVDHNTGMISVYHVDEKIVYTFLFTEIEDIA